MALMPCQKYTPTDCLFGDFARWDNIEVLNKSTIFYNVVLSVPANKPQGIYTCKNSCGKIPPKFRRFLLV